MWRPSIALRGIIQVRPSRRRCRVRRRPGLVPAVRVHGRRRYRLAGAVPRSTLVGRVCGRRRRPGVAAVVPRGGSRGDGALRRRGLWRGRVWVWRLVVGPQHLVHEGRRCGSRAGWPGPAAVVVRQSVERIRTRRRGVVRGGVRWRRVELARVRGRVVVARVRGRIVVARVRGRIELARVRGRIALAVGRRQGAPKRRRALQGAKRRVRRLYGLSGRVYRGVSETRAGPKPPEGTLDQGSYRRVPGVGAVGCR